MDATEAKMMTNNSSPKITTDVFFSLSLRHVCLSLDEKYVYIFKISQFLDSLWGADKNLIENEELVDLRFTTNC